MNLDDIMEMYRAAVATVSQESYDQGYSDALLSIENSLRMVIEARKEEAKGNPWSNDISFDELFKLLAEEGE